MQALPRCRRGQPGRLREYLHAGHLTPYTAATPGPRRICCRLGTTADDRSSSLGCGPGRPALRNADMSNEALARVQIEALRAAHQGVHIELSNVSEKPANTATRCARSTSAACRPLRRHRSRCWSRRCASASARHRRAGCGLTGITTARRRPGRLAGPGLRSADQAAVHAQAVHRRRRRRQRGHLADAGGGLPAGPGSGGRGAAAFAWEEPLRDRCAGGDAGLAGLACHAVFFAVINPVAPAFGIAPCPLTGFTIGLSMPTSTPVPRRLLVIPPVWSVGRSAAFMLGAPQDWP